MAKNCNVGLDGRSRDEDGEIRRKRGDTRIRSLRDTYGEDFLSAWRSDTRLDTVREETGKDLSELVREHRRKH